MKILALFAIAVLFLIVSCSREPQPIQYGKDACAHCRMTIMDKRFAAEIVTPKGKVFKFDAAECMAAYLKTEPQIAADQNTIFLVCTYNKPGVLVNAQNCYFLSDGIFKSPMGGNLAAFISKERATTAIDSKTAKLYNWPEMLKTR